MVDFSVHTARFCNQFVTDLKKEIIITCASTQDEDLVQILQCQECMKCT